MKRFFILLALVSATLYATPLPVKRSIFAARQPIRFEVHPNAAINTKTGQTLVVWERHPGNHPGHSTWGRFVGLQGSASGAAFQIVSGPNTYFPSAVYNNALNEFGLTFSNEPRGHFVVYAQRLKANGRPLGPAVQVSQDDPGSSFINDFPEIVFNNQTGNYTVFWIRNGSDAGLYAAVLQGNLNFVQPAVLVRRTEPEGNSGRPPYVLDVEHHSATGKIAVLVYQHRAGFTTSTNPELDYFLGVLNPDLSGIQPSSFQKINSNAVTGSPGAQIHFLPDGSGIVAFQDSANVKLRKISTTLRFAGASYAAFKAPLTNQKLFHPVLSFASGALGVQGMIVAVRDPFNNDGSGTIVAQRLNSQARPLDAPFSIERNFDRMGGQDLFPLRMNPTSSSYRFVSVYVQGVQQDIPPGPTESSGLILLNFGFTN